MSGIIEPFAVGLGVMIAAFAAAFGAGWLIERGEGAPWDIIAVGALALLIVGGVGFACYALGVAVLGR